MKTTRYTGSPDSNPAQWLRINELTTQPGPGSAYRVTIEPIEVITVTVNDPDTIQSLRDLLAEASGPVIAWATHYQLKHGLSAPHAVHSAIIKKIEEAIK